MLRRLVIIAAMLIWLVPPVSAAPLAAVVAGIATAAGASVAVANIIGAVVVAGLAVAASLLFRTPAPKPSDVAGVIRQDVPVRWVHYGRRRVGGALMFIETNSGNLSQIVAHGTCFCEAYERTFLDGRELVLDGSGQVTGIVTDDPEEENPYPANAVYVLTMPGWSEQAALTTMLTTFPAIWSSAHRLRGIAYSYILAGGLGSDDFNKAYPNRIPQIEQIGRFSRPLDPRTGSIAWTRNLALQLADYLASPDGLQIPREMINTARLIAAANLCDQEIVTADGDTIGRWHGGLSYQMDAEPASVISRFLPAMDGRLTLLPDATIAIDAGAFVEPTVILDDSCIIAYELRAGGDPATEANEVVVKFTYAAADYAEASSDPWRNEADIAESGQTKTLSIEAYEVETHNHARRIAKLAAARALPAYQGTVTTNLKGLEAWDQRFVRLRGTMYGLDHVFEVQAVSFDPDALTVTLTVIAFDGSAYDFDASTEEGTPPDVGDAATTVTIDAPTGLAAEAGARTVSAGVLAPIINVSWAAPIRAQSGAQAQISVHGADQWRDITLRRNTSPPTGAVAESIDNGETYDIRVRWKGPDSPYSTVTVAAVADPNAPGHPTECSAASPSAGAVFVAWRPPATDAYAGVKIYGSTSNDFATASLKRTVPDSPSTTLQGATVTGLTSGTWYFWVTAYNGSLVESAAEPTGAVTVI